MVENARTPQRAARTLPIQTQDTLLINNNDFWVKLSEVEDLIKVVQVLLEEQRVPREVSQ